MAETIPELAEPGKGYPADNTQPTASTARLSLIGLSSRKILWILLYLIPVLILVYVSFSEWNYDDAFITYRYARNIASGVGFVYNPGERVLSTTTPLFTILLAAGSLLWDDIPQIANLLGVIGIGLGALFLWDLCWQKNAPVVGFVCLVLYPTFPLLVTTIGLETPLYIAFCLGAFAVYERKQYSLAALMAALACLTRPDGILVAVILTIHYIATQRSLPPTRPALIFVSLVLPWLVFSILYFGTPIPAALIAKRNQGSMLISERFSAGLLTILRPYTRRILYIIEFLLGLLGIGYLLIRQKSNWVTLFAWTIGYFLTYSFLGVSRYPWYYAPLVPVFLVCIGSGFSALLLLGKRMGRKFSLSLQVLLVSVVLISLGTVQALHVRQIAKNPDQRREIYRAIGEWLATNSLESELVGTLEVGIIGYHSLRPMLDFAGLLQPEIGSRLGPEVSYDDAALWAAENFNPDYLVLQEKLYPALESRFASEHCLLIKEFFGMDYGYAGNLNVYKCESR